MTQTDILTLISLTSPLLVFLASFLAHKLYSHMTPQQQTVVHDLANMVVPAVEQTCSALAGEAKRQEAVRIIGEILTSIGVKNVSSALINAAIEAAVFSMNQGRMTATTVKLPIVKS